MRTNIITILAITAAALLWFPQYLHAQQVDTNPIELPSTSVWQQMKYSNVAGASLYTGTMNLSIPVFNYHDSDFDIPLSLDYSTNGYKPNIMTGILGHEWSLGLGGVITRNVRGLPDEYRSASRYGFQELHNSPEITSVEQFNGFNTDYDDDSIQAISPRIFYAPDGWDMDGDLIDLEPDIFQFSFPGHSGKFQLGYNGAIHVYGTNTRSSEYKVEIPRYNLDAITIVTGDGYRYTFGTGDAREQAGDHITAWKLSRIETPSGRSVTFTYTHNPRSESGVLSYANFYNYAPDFHCYSFLGNYYDEWGIQHNLEYNFSPVRPQLSTVYVSAPDKVSFDNGTVIDFFYKNPTQLESGEGTALGNLPKLDRIVVKNSDGTELRTCNLEYTYPLASSSNKLCFLSEVTLSGEGRYTFDYNYTSSTIFPKHGTFKIDHWGYFNDSSATAQSFYSHITQGDYLQETINTTLRDPDTASAMLGVMTAVQYPTGGRTTFEYEGNDYSAYEDNDGYPYFTPYLHDTPSSRSLTAGGVRIKAIKDYSSASGGTPVYTRSYSYKDDSGHSSGVRGPLPRYGLAYYKDKVTGDFINVYLGSYNNILPTDGTHIEYTYVKETLPQGHNIYEFITRENCLDGKVIWEGTNLYNLMYHTRFRPNVSDEDALDAIFAVMSPVTSMQATRGRLLSVDSYDAGNNLKRHSATTYEDFTYAFETLGKIWNYQSMYLGATRVPTITGDIRPLSTTTVTDGVSDTETVAYDAFRNIRSRTRGGHTSKYFYLQDIDMRSSYSDFTDITWWNTFAGGSVCAKMKELNMVNSPLQTEAYDGDGVLHLLRYIYDFRTSSDHSAVYLKSVQEYDGTTWRTVLSYDARDSKGRILQTSDADGISTAYVWGYYGLYPVAEVVGATLAQIKAVSGLYYIENAPLSGSLTDSQASALRGLGEATVWECSPLIGVTRETTPDGRSTSYTYNDSGKAYQLLNDLGEKISTNLYSTDNRQQ